MDKKQAKALRRKNRLEAKRDRAKQRAIKQEFHKFNMTVEQLKKAQSQRTLWGKLKKALKLA